MRPLSMHRRVYVTLFLGDGNNPNRDSGPMVSKLGANMRVTAVFELKHVQVIRVAHQVDRKPKEGLVVRGVCSVL